MRVGVTGHQRLDDPEGWQWVADVMRHELAQLPVPLTAVTSLAIGADQLLARLVLDRGGTVYAVLPFAGIERSFSPSDLPAYRELVSRSSIEVLQTLGSDEDAYLAAGKRVVDDSDIVFAVWNGRPAKGKGGTADVVAYAKQRGRPVLHINPVTRRVIRTS
jgi:hypothetical protein